MSDPASDTTACGSCRHMIVPPDAAGRRVIRKDKAYTCGYKVEWPTLPQSITGAHGHRLPTASYVWQDYGTSCPVWERKL